MMRRRYEVSISEEDYLAFNRFYFFDSKTGKRTVLKLRMLYLVLVAVLFLMCCFISDYWFGVVVGGIVFAAIGVISFLFMPKLIWAGQTRRLRKMTRDDSLFDSEVTIDFRDNEILEVTPSGKKIVVPYSESRRICVLPNVIYITVAESLGGFILPDSTFESNEERQALIDYLKEKIGVEEG